MPFDSLTQRAAPCVACHGKEGRASPDGYYPRIAGKPAGYLYNQLRNFRNGLRQQYPVMIYMVQHMSDAYLQELAGYFADQHPPYPAPARPPASQAVLERGRTLALEGDKALKVPACAGCHGSALTGIQPSIPGLLGLPRDYINAQFGAWREGVRRAAAPDCMHDITKRLTPEDIGAVSSWLATQPVPPDPNAVRVEGRRLPLACGSFPQ